MILEKINLGVKVKFNTLHIQQVAFREEAQEYFSNDYHTVVKATSNGFYCRYNSAVYFFDNDDIVDVVTKETNPEFFL